jgi:hypothetical protein
VTDETLSRGDLISWSYGSRGRCDIYFIADVVENDVYIYSCEFCRFSFFNPHSLHSLKKEMNRGVIKKL